MSTAQDVTVHMTFAEMMIGTLTGEVASDGEFLLEHDARRYVEDLLAADAQRRAIEREVRTALDERCPVAAVIGWRAWSGRAAS